MKAEPLKERHAIFDEAFVELVVWRLPWPVAGGQHGFMYRLAFVVKGRCVLRYNNERGKGDHKHMGEKLLKMMTGAGPMTIREAARRLGRDVKAVHGDVHALLNTGILEKTESGFSSPTTLYMLILL